jgi:hypothetical protein
MIWTDRTVHHCANLDECQGQEVSHDPRNNACLLRVQEKWSSSASDVRWR